MKKTGCFFIIAFLGALCLLSCRSPHSSVKGNQDDWDTLRMSWSKYSNTELGFTFHYSNTWTKAGDDIRMTDLTGNLTALQINFKNEASGMTLLVVYHLAPQGKEICEKAVSQFDPTKDSKRDVAGMPAVLLNSRLTVDGRGNALEPPVDLITAHFPAKDPGASVEVQFKTPDGKQVSELLKFERLLDSFRFE